MICKGCGKVGLRGQDDFKKGYCPNCQGTSAEIKKVKNALMTAFGGKGITGFAQWLKMGGFLHNITDDSEVAKYNDRVDVIREMIGEKAYDKLIIGVARVVLDLADES